MVVPKSLNLMFGKALAHADKTMIVELVEENEIDVNSVLDKEYGRTLLHESLTPLGDYIGSDLHVEIVKYLLDKGADPGIKTKRQYNSLHIALADHRLSKIALLLLNSYKLDVNDVDLNGNNAIFIAIREYRNAWRPEQKEIKNTRFKIIEKLLECGANLDQLNNHNVSARRWLELSDDPQLHNLVEKYDIK